MPYRLSLPKNPQQSRAAATLGDHNRLTAHFRPHGDNNEEAIEDTESARQKLIVEEEDPMMRNMSMMDHQVNNLNVLDTLHEYGLARLKLD